MVRLDRLSKSFGGRKALEGLSLEVQRGEIFGLLGHNGAGKSTTFGLMLGQVHPDSGEAFIGGYSVQRHRSSALQRVGAIFEAPAFYHYLSGWNNLRYFVSLSGGAPTEKMRSVVELVGLTERIDDKVQAYSHGMRQRLALAQALLPDPEFIILDEPMDGLDPEGIHEMRRLIARLREERGLTVLLSSHALSEMEQLCDRVAILHRGRMVFCGEWNHESNLWRLCLDDWSKAAPALSEAGAKVEAPGLVGLPEGKDISEIVSALVASGVKVREVGKVRQTLEDFYMKRVGQ